AVRVGFDVPATFLLRPSSQSTKINLPLPPHSADTPPFLLYIQHLKAPNSEQLIKYQYTTLRDASFIRSSDTFRLPQRRVLNGTIRAKPESLTNLFLSPPLTLKPTH
ncbi:unnamed protein product, partial [Ectocarpus sp. 12 AP-2014]